MGRTSVLAARPALIRRGQQLLHRQCSLWGQDIRWKEGNLLLRYGFRRQRPPADVSGCSQYTLELNSHRRICLWGFGFFFGRERGIHVNRYKFVPRLARFKQNVWTPTELNAGPRLATTFLLEQAVRWISGYESWILGECGPEYRCSCMEEISERSFHPRLIAEDWLEFAEDLLPPKSALSGEADPSL